MKVAIFGPVCKDSITIDDDTKDQLGGIPYYTGVAMSSLGAEVTAYITYHSTDDAWVRNNFRNVSIRHIEAPGTLHFSRSYSSKNPDVCLSIHIEYFPNPVASQSELFQEAQDADYIILSPLLHDNIQPEFFRDIKNALHKPVVYGNFGMFTYAENNELVQKNPEQFMKAVPYIDYLFLDEKEIQFATSTEGVQEAAAKVLKRGVKEVVVTSGSKGSMIFSEHDTYNIPAYVPERIVDPTGAGDTYLAGYITALEFYADPVQRGKFAAMAATLSLEKRGAFTESKEEVLRRLRQCGESF